MSEILVCLKNKLRYLDPKNIKIVSFVNRSNREKLKALEYQINKLSIVSYIYIIKMNLFVSFSQLRLAVLQFKSSFY